MKLSLTIPTILAVAAAVSACSPKLDWRDYRAADAAYSVLFPGKPATHTRTVKLDGRDAPMTMTAAEVDGTVFAVGSAELADAPQAEAAVQSLRTAMVRNIGGTITSEAVREGGLEIAAHGANNGRPMQLHGRFLARGSRAYQVIVLGPEKAVDTENIDTFIRSFKLN
ncbi:hypothetical protein [Massilia sp. METH4]|uniref:hypothetical protein n=1 Tax=Massilia sp. METH4 TaxID=3123041 RepID=UPI0030CF000E